MGGDFLPQGVLGTVRSHSPGHQIHPVRVYQGHQVDGADFRQSPGRYPQKGILFFQGPGTVPGKFQKNQSGNPLIGMVGGRKKHRPLSKAHTQRQHLPPERGAAQTPKPCLGTVSGKAL